ncbi:MAG: DUF896 domain-containing protein [Oscillospiraceae bacterium]|nr:DUF896 domain-containing protein [Oscillospiraceae bacterium]
MTKEKIDRINELARKSREEGLTDEEKREQTELRYEYRSSVMANLKAQLDNIEIIDAPKNDNNQK